MNKETLLRAMTDIRDDYIEEAMPEGSVRKKQSIGSLFKTGGILSFAAVLLVCAGLWIHNLPENSVESGNPLKAYETLAEAEKAAGFELQAPEEIAGAVQSGYYVIGGTVLEVRYADGADETVCTVRKAPGEEDISGDYNVYEGTETLQYFGISLQAEISYDDAGIRKAVWTKDGFSYAVLASGMDRGTLTEVIACIMGQ